MSGIESDGQVQETAFTGAVADGDATTQGRPPNNEPIRSSTRVLAPDLLRGTLMILQAIDHCSLTVGAWRHGVALEPEADGTPVTEWNEPVAWTARMLTHICAPGFMFLLGMGVVYFGHSRSKLGWTPGQMARHFAIRAFALFAVNQIFITLPAGRFHSWLINPVLAALAINYLLAGLLWLALTALEMTLASLLAALLPKDPERQPLLSESSTRGDTRGATIAWHFHNVLLAALTAVTIWWNIALSPHHGYCVDGDAPPTGSMGRPVYGMAFDFWFYPAVSAHIMSAFPPLGWISFAILGLLYGRIATARTWKPYVLNAANVVAGSSLFLLFILTRLLRLGNLSEDCLGMPEQHTQTASNPYLASFRSFLYIVKYPPDVAFFALTMAVNFMLLAGFGALPHKVARKLKPLLIFGTSALFFYIVHMLLYATLGAVAKTWFGHPIDGKDPFNGEPQKGVGDGAVMWITYLLGLMILYPLCRWYGNFKSGKGPDSVWRFF